MRILHISDTHGSVPAIDLDGVDIVCHSGDILPNRTRGDLNIEPGWQETWMMQNAHRFVEQLGGKPLVYVRGNHDFISPVPALVACGVEAYDITGRGCEVGGVKFYGFGSTPLFNGEWWSELRPEVMELAVEEVKLDLEAYKPRVFVSHGPLYGYLDTCRGQHLGNRHLRDMLFENCEWLPEIVLCGHIHEACGGPALVKTMRGPVRIYNSATICQVVDV